MTQPDTMKSPAAEQSAEQESKTFTQADVDRIIADRLRRESEKYADYDDLKARATDADRLRQERESETEKQVREAREQAANEERARTAPRLVAAEFRAAAKGVLTDAQREALLEDLDLSKYLTKQGEVDLDKVIRKVEAFAPAPGGGAPKPDPSQGPRGGKVTGKDEGLAEARKRFGTPQH